MVNRFDVEKMNVNITWVSEAILQTLENAGLLCCQDELAIISV
jgi:hypothetical protein